MRQTIAEIERRRKRERARLSAERDLRASGLSAEDARGWSAAWEAEAARQSLHPDSEYFWDAGYGWIDAQRSFGTVPRSDLEMQRTVDWSTPGDGEDLARIAG